MTYVQGDAVEEAVLASAVEGAEVVVGALAPRGPLAESFRDVYRVLARLAADSGAGMFLVGGTPRCDRRPERSASSPISASCLPSCTRRSSPARP